ncbi:MAG: hypothetical protein H6562_08465 [Lewinellaceae bacterium]|nr:hypothetical protein [Lewinellaceae bacterium]
MPKRDKDQKQQTENQKLINQKIKSNPFTPMSSLLGAFSFVTFFWRPKESKQKAPGYAAVPKIALHSVAQNKLALNAWLKPHA